MPAWRRWLLLAGLAVLATACDSRTAEHGARPVTVSEQGPRMVTLAPHLTELVFAAGAGAQLVGVVEFSDFPVEARALPRVGDAFRVDFEAIAALSPDLVLAWRSGNPPEVLQQLRTLGYRVVALEPADLAGIGEQLRLIGELAGTLATADSAADHYQSGLAALREKASAREVITVFYQVAAQPLLTVTDEHVIGQVLALCGGRNVFGSLNGLAPIIAEEAVLDLAPQVIIATGFGSDADPELELARWRGWPQLPATRLGNLFVIDADLLSRPGPRLLDGARAVCAALEEARAHISQDAGADATANSVTGRAANPAAFARAVR